jgi:hypothetical protein
MLWSVPLAVGMAIFLWETKGTPSAGEKASRLLVDPTEPAHRSGRLGFALTILPVAALFFVIGLLQGAVFVNLGVTGALAAPMAVGAAAMVLIPFWLRLVWRQGAARQRPVRAVRPPNRSAPVHSR